MTAAREVLAQFEVPRLGELPADQRGAFVVACNKAAEVAEL